MTVAIAYADLANDWMVCKAEEAKWLAKRRDIEARLGEYFEGFPETGSRSLRMDGFKTTKSQDLNIRVANKPLFESTVSAGLFPADLLKTVLYDTGFKRLRTKAMQQDSEALKIYGQILPMFEVKPAMPLFEVVQYE